MSARDNWVDALNKSIASMQVPAEAFSKAAKELSDQVNRLLASVCMVPAHFWETRRRVVIPEFHKLYVKPMQVGMPTMRQEIEIEIEGKVIQGWLIGMYASRFAVVIEHRNHRAVYYEIPPWRWKMVEDQLLSELVPQIMAEIKTEYVWKPRQASIESETSTPEDAT